MKTDKFFKGETIGDLLRAVGAAAGILLTVALVFFYLYLPGRTHHLESTIVPDFLGLPSSSLDSAITAAGLRYEINDSSYTDDYGPLEVSRQFPKPGSAVKPGRKIFISINRTDPPTVPVPALQDLSLINASATLISNGLRPGQIIYEPGPFADLVMSMRIGSRTLREGYRVPKGTMIDLVVGDGAGPKDFVVNNLVGTTLENAILLLSNWNLHLGTVEVGPGADTTGVEVFVYRQRPAAGDSVRIGEPIHLWIAPKDYVPADDSTEIDF
ncbi:MAG: PASTA domain-containing protein [Bacteroidota bacterium]